MRVAMMRQVKYCDQEINDNICISFMNTNVYHTFTDVDMKSDIVYMKSDRNALINIKLHP